MYLPKKFCFSMTCRIEDEINIKTRSLSVSDKTFQLTLFQEKKISEKARGKLALLITDAELCTFRERDLFISNIRLSAIKEVIKKIRALQYFFFCFFSFVLHLQLLRAFVILHLTLPSFKGLKKVNTYDIFVLLV